MAGRPVRQLRAELNVTVELRRRSRSATVDVRDRERADIILLRLEGIGVEAVAEQLRTTPKRVSTWSRRFEMSGLDGLLDRPGRGRKASISEAKVARVLTEATCPPEGRRRWSIRSMGRHAGISASSVQRLWSKNDLKPHRLRTFKLSNDPKFEEKFWDVIGLYLDPPARHCPIFCAGGRLSSSDDEPFAEDHGELAFRLTPFPRRPFPFVCCVIEHEV